MDPMTMSLAAGGAKLASGLFSAGGASTANKKNKRAKDQLGFLADSYRAYGDPVLDSLTSGYAPGGFLRSIGAAAGVAAANQRYGKTAGALRSNAWKVGGPRAGRFLGGLRDADNARMLGIADAYTGADLDATQQLARLFSAQLGVQDAFPVRIAQNQNLGLAQGISQFASQLDAPNRL